MQPKNTIAPHLDRRHEPRVNLSFILYLRPAVNKPSNLQEVRVVNASAHGVRIVSDIKLEIGTTIELIGFNGRFSGTAIVRNISERNINDWYVGLSITKKSGSWVVC